MVTTQTDVVDRDISHSVAVQNRSDSALFSMTLARNGRGIQRLATTGNLALRLLT